MRIIKLAGLLPALCLISSQAMAEGFYAGAKAGWMDPDIRGFDEATNLGVQGGYTFGAPDTGITWAVEAELTTTISDGDVQAFGSSGNWDVDTQAIYGVLRIGDALYGKLRLGFLHEDASASVVGASADGSDSGVSGGLGGGWRANQQLSFELEYTMVEEDIDFYSVGMNFAF
ncbi:outer membrane protein with beta-barrel domain [Thiogranum longum]|uniref:Outer membrane protein with beta-barrel domain n=1 Tax=Thiogranum longum TaxID=1537524 RepID=A0A4R1H5J6_9GAMM|nr:outer membrane beta-barrel protein [Thiogranum longum]TCK16994.1 outer membrane protein with beta-barrel domain [Thiogranum longum]